MEVVRRIFYMSARRGVLEGSSKQAGAGGPPDAQAGKALEPLILQGLYPRRRLQATHLRRDQSCGYATGSGSPGPEQELWALVVQPAWPQGAASFGAPWWPSLPQNSRVVSEAQGGVDRGTRTRLGSTS
jgi:hypothetical protein